MSQAFDSILILLQEYVIFTHLNPKRQAEELDQDQDQNWIIDPKNVEVLDQKDQLGSVDPEI